MTLKEVKVTTVLLLDRKLDVKKHIFQKRRDWETDDLALHCILRKAALNCFVVWFFFFWPLHIGFSNLECNLIWE